jgi:predicted hydrocarbon binding protein
VCWGRQADEPCCQLAGGLLEAATSWASGGRRFAVDEIKCKARGDASCTFQIAKAPVDNG